MTAPLDELATAARDALARDVFVKMTFAAPQPGGEVRRLVLRPIVLRGEPKWQWVESHGTRDVTRNVAPEQALVEALALFGHTFRSAHLHTTERSLQLDGTQRVPRLFEAVAVHQAPPDTSHDRGRKRVTELDPRWLTALGITTANGKPRKDSEHKLQQVHRFVEVLDHLLGDAIQRADRFRLIDVGCGRGALTFAAWQYLRAVIPNAQVIGVELRPELAAKSEAIARELACDGLSFVPGSVADADLAEADVVVALHACDTATDDALALGVAAGARWLVVAPCCHKELRPRLVTPTVLGPALRHGILRTREAEIVTDALRATLLSAAGYEAKVFEFVSSEHTDKNLLITARRTAPEPGAAEAARDLARFYGVTRQHLAERLGIPLD